MVIFFQYISKLAIAQETALQLPSFIALFVLKWFLKIFAIDCCCHVKLT